VTLHLYDSFSREVRPVVPLDGQSLRFYCCGPTVYGPAHIGNFRTFVLQDIFRRVVEATGTATRHVRNITDVDDKTIRQSQAEHLPLVDFCAQWTSRFHDDAAALAILPPHVEPGAVAHITDQIVLIERLIAGGHAYATEDGSVYFRVNSFPAYGALSRLAERTITTSDVSRESSDEYTRDSAADFALWKAHRPEDGENQWPSPWGGGRPGWHIECSAMAIKHLGESFDLHSGGIDLLFPHHENEIAQSEAATGKTFARHWFHVAHLMVDGGKMSKSLGNLYTLSDVLARGLAAEDLRYALLAGSYRQPLNFTWDSLTSARQSLARLRELRERLPENTENSDGFGIFQPVFDALLDDLNTPEALGRLFRLVRELNAALDSGTPAGVDRQQMDRVFEVFGFKPAPKREVPAEILALAEQRVAARKGRDWSAADTLRAQIAAGGWQVKDTAAGFELLPL